MQPSPPPLNKRSKLKLVYPSPPQKMSWYKEYLGKKSKLRWHYPIYFAVASWVNLRWLFMGGIILPQSRYILIPIFDITVYSSCYPFLFYIYPMKEYWIWTSKILQIILHTYINVKQKTKVPYYCIFYCYLDVTDRLGLFIFIWWFLGREPIFQYLVPTKIKTL